MIFKKLSDTLSVAAQLSPADLKDAAAAGYRSILCNRPDGEGGPDQPQFGDIEAAALAAGLSVAYQPVVSAAMKDEDGAAFARIVEGLPKPVLAYCRTGTRCTYLWALGEAQRGADPHHLVNLASGAGYDLTGLGPKLDALAQSSRR